MSELFSGLEEISGQVKEYIHTGIDRIKLKTAEKTSLVVADVMAIVIVVAVFLLFLVFVSIAGAYALSAWIGEPYAGFLIVGMIYLFLAIIVWKWRDRIIRVPVMRNILAQLFDKNEADEKD